MSETDHVATVAGFILAGGQSSRMGVDKGLLEIVGEPMIVRAARLVEAVAGVAAVVVGRPENIRGAGFGRMGVVGPGGGGGGTPEKYQGVGLRAIADDWPGCGPLGGIATALRASDADWNLIVAC